MRRVLASMVIVGLLWCVPVHAASSFADPAFQQQWQRTEGSVPNFWGPLETAHSGQQEPYAGVIGGQRLVQYFDKARMELTPPIGGVTNGLLTVEMRGGRIQLGDTTFDQRIPPRVNVAGDPGSDGFTYADFALTPERDTHKDGPNVPYIYDGGQIGTAQNTPENWPDANRRYTYLSDPGGRYAQFVFQPFYDFIMGLPLSISQTTGYAISPIIWTRPKVGGVGKTVLVQAFERRVLTYTPSNIPESRVEFGNIGQHYYQWRYVAPLVSAVAPATNASPVASTTTADAADVHVRATAGTTAIAVEKDTGNTTTITFVRFLDPAKSTNQFEQPMAGNKYVAVEITIQNNEPRDISLSATPYILRTTDAFEYHGEIESGVGQPISIDRLTPGGKRDGYIVFEVPANAAAKFIRYKPDAIKYAIHFDF